MSTPKVLTITMNPSVDIGTEASEIIPDQKTRCKEPVYDPGGGGINVARVLKRLGISVDALFVAGGHSGALLQKMVDEEAITSIYIEGPDATRENIAIIDNSTGKQFRFVMPGKISDEDTLAHTLTKIESIISDYEFVIGSGSLPDGTPTNFYSQIAAIVKKAGKQFVLDTSGTSLFEGLHSGADYIKPNQEEFAEMKRIFGVKSDEDLCQFLFEKGVKNIIHTFGKEKTLHITPTETTRFTPPKVEVRSSIGAGDSFVGGLVAGLIKGLPENKAVGYGISAAASTLQSEGTDLCDAGEVEQIFAENFS